MIEAAIATAQARDLRSAVMTFHPHPIAVMRPELAPPELATLARRIELASEIEPDEVIVVPFTAALSQVGRRPVRPRGAAAGGWAPTR